MGMLLIPIIILEAAIYYYKLKLTPAYAFKVSAKANLVSTIVGIPVCWILLVIAEFIIIAIIGTSYEAGAFKSVPWLLDNDFAGALGLVICSPWPPPNDVNLNWIIPIALLILQIPFCLASIYIELRVVKAMRPILPFKSAVVWANIASYAATALLITIMFLAGGFEKYAYSFTIIRYREHQRAATENLHKHNSPTTTASRTHTLDPRPKYFP